METSEPYEAEVFLNPSKDLKPDHPMGETTSLTYTDLLVYTHEGPEGWYRAGIGRMCLENADHRLLHNGCTIEESCERLDVHQRSDDYLVLKKGDKLVLQWRYDGDSLGRDPSICRAQVFQASLYAEQDEP